MRTRGQFSTKLFLLVFSLVIVLLVAFAAVLYWNTRRLTLQTATDDLSKNTQQLSYQMDNVFKQLNTLSLQMVSAPSLREYCQNNQALNFDSPSFQSILNKLSTQVILTTDYPTRITVYNAEGSYASIGIPCNSRAVQRFFGSETYADWYDGRNQFSAYVQILPPHTDPWSGKDVTYLSFLRRMTNFVTFDQIGLVEIQLSPKILLDIGRAAKMEDSEVYLTDRDGTLFCASGSAEDAAKIFAAYQAAAQDTFRLEGGSSPTLVSVSSLSFSGLLLMQVQPESAVLTVARAFGIQMIVICLLLIFVFLLVVFFLTRRLTAPLRNLQSVIASLTPGHPETESADEFRALALSFSALHARLDAAINDAVDARTKQERLQFTALQAQSNPHFIFNVVTVISSLSAEEGNQRVCDVATAFSEMLRYILTDNLETVPLCTELTHCENYLLIMKARHETQLEYQIQTDPGLLSCPVPKLSLQPLLENCFKHGFRSPPYVLELTIGRKNGSVEIVVRDHGAGMMPQALARLREQTFRPGSEAGRRQDGGLGLHSTFLRFRHLYEDAAMEITASPNQGCAVTITFSEETRRTKNDTSDDRGG